MRFTSLTTALALCLSLAAADTTTSTETLTKTITITQCNPTVSNCPGRMNSTTAYPTTNSTMASATAAYANSTTMHVPTTTALPGITKISAGPTVATVSASDANGLIVQSGVLLGVLAAGIAYLA